MIPFPKFRKIIRKFCRKSCFTTFDRLSALFDRLNRNWVAIDSSRGSKIIFLPFRSIKPKFQPIENAKFQIFHLENSKTWIFSLWNNIFQTQTSLLQPIHVYIYIYNNKLPIISSENNSKYNGSWVQCFKSQTSWTITNLICNVHYQI